MGKFEELDALFDVVFISDFVSLDAGTDANLMVPPALFVLFVEGVFDLAVEFVEVDLVDSVLELVVFCSKTPDRATMNELPRRLWIRSFSENL